MWVVDTCVVLDLLENDPSFGQSSAQMLQDRFASGLVLCPVTMIELSPAFSGNLIKQNLFLDLAGFRREEPWTIKDTERAHDAWNLHIQSRRSTRFPKRPVADLLIGAFATRFEGLITRNPDNFSPWFPPLPLLNPTPREKATRHGQETFKKAAA